jgi:hypothetical protein
VNEPQNCGDQEPSPFLLFFEILTMHSGSESEDGMEPEEFSDPITLSLMVPVVFIIYIL